MSSSTEKLIHGKFIFLLCLSFMVFWGSGAQAQKSSNFFTDREQQWLDEHPTLRLGVGIAFPPFMWVQEKNGQKMFMGMVSDYIGLLGEKLGVNMEIVFGIPFDEALARGRAGRIDFFPCISKTPERSEFLLFTQPYLSYPLVIITREDAPIIGGLKELGGKRFATVKHLVVYSKLKNEYSNLHLNYVFTRKVEENLEAVSMGRADACIINLAVASYYIQKKGLTNLRIAAPVNWKGMQLAIGVRKDWPILQGIVEKALASIPQEEKDRISQRWIRAEYEPGVAIDRIWRWSLWIGLGVAVLFGLVFIWNRRLRKEIVEKEKAEYALMKSERKLSTLIGNLPGMAYRCLNNKDWTMLYISDGCKALTGYEPSELIMNRALSYNDLIVRKDRRHVWDSVQTAVDGNRPFTIEYRIRDKSRNERWVWERGLCVAGLKGDELVLEGFISDITEKRQLQTQLQQSQKMEALGLMAGGVAHDLNNILSGIVSYPELLLMDLPEESPLRKPIKTIQESGMRAADVVADLLTVARGVAIAKEVFNLNPLIEGYLNSAEHQKLAVTHPSVTFKTEIDSDLLNMSCSPTHIKKTLMNLVANASEAIEGSGAVTISTTNRYLDEPLKGYEDVRTGEYAVLTVSDNGSGITPGDIERIFEPFYTKKVMGRSGTGLGLAVVWNTVQNCNGYINVKSGDKGTVFELYFPVTRQTVAETKEQAPLENYLGHGEKILVVDDEERQREIACGILIKLGYLALAVSSGEEAIEYVKEHPVDLIVLDMVMPKGIGGRETYEEIIKIHPGQKAIIASGFSETQEVKMAQELGAGKYIKKPYILEKIGLAIREELVK